MFPTLLLGSFKAAIGGSKSSPTPVPKEDVYVSHRASHCPRRAPDAGSRGGSRTRSGLGPRQSREREGRHPGTLYRHACRWRLIRADGTFTVPVGKRLVIEHLSGLARMQEQQRPAEVALTTTVNSVFAPHPLLLIEQSSGGTTGHTFVANHAVQIYGDPGTTVRFNFLRNTSTGDALFFATLSGYLVTFP